MKTAKTKKKTFLKRNNHLPLPICSNNNGGHQKFIGKFNGLSIIVKDLDHILKLYLNGFFGKGNLSRSYPQFNTDKTTVIRNRQLQNRKAWAEKLDKCSITSKSLIVIPDSDSENEDYFTNLKPTYHLDKSNLKEVLALSLEESFFLHDAIKCLDIYADEILLPSEEIWDIFQDTDKYFLQNYIVYYYYRSRNWVVKTGLKFGGDFLLYKEGPAFHHASYLVIIDVIDSTTHNRREDLCRRSMLVQNIIGLQRLCETAGKELLICTIIWPENNINAPIEIKQIKIKELSFKRWLLPQENSLD